MSEGHTKKALSCQTEFGYYSLGNGVSVIDGFPIEEKHGQHLRKFDLAAMCKSYSREKN